MYLFVLVFLSLMIRLSDKIVFEVVNVIFYCNVIGNFVLKISWIKDGKVVVLGDILRIINIKRN